MSAFPALNQEDMDLIDRTLQELLQKSEAHLALLVEKAGYLIHQSGNQDALDTTTFLGQDVNARERMANEFARALVSAILEAF